MNRTKSSTLFDRAGLSIAGGVNSPVRAYKSVDMTPPFIERAQGAEIVDADGNTYIDYVGSWGPMILGYGDDRVSAAVSEAMAKGTSFGALHEKVRTVGPRAAVRTFSCKAPRDLSTPSDFPVCGNSPAPEVRSAATSEQ